jgi:uncharacterized membrane protein
MTAHYDVPIEKVFELATDYKRYPEWNVSYSEVDQVSGPTDKVGTKFHTIMKLLGRPIEGWAEVAEAETPRLIKLIGTGKEGGKLELIDRFTPVGIAGTDVEMEVDYELPAPMESHVSDKVFVEKAVERNLRHSLENFKALVEAKEPILV